MSSAPSSKDESATAASTSAKPFAAPAILTRFRWVICAMLLLGMTKNYMDRQVIGILKITLQHTFSWNEVDYGNLVAVFQAAYALGLLLVGRLIDRLGTRVGFALAMTLWSVASMAQGVMSSLHGFLGARFALGFGEAGVFPATAKSIAEWFPKKERALAMGIANAGTNIGAIITPLIVPWITLHWGWRWAFFLIGSIGFLWLAVWLWLYRLPAEHPRCSPAERAYIHSEPQDPGEKAGWLMLFPHKQTWAFCLAKFIIDPIWWFYLFWAPDFLQRQHGLSLMQLGLPLVVIYLLADGGSIAGGWLSSALIHRGRSVNSSRKITMLICAVSVVPIIITPRVTSTIGAVLLLGLAAAAHQGFSTNLLTLPSDMFPRKAVASVVGIGGMFGAFGGLLIAKIVSYLLQWTGSYVIPFLMAGSAYLLALAALQLLAPRLEPVTVHAPEP
jgi:MFS transporter, ACS family, aldohexuronate transporter